jgi:cation:H+ antiporter
MAGDGQWSPWWFLGLFLAASLLTLWRLERMSDHGFEGTLLGTLITPYFSGLGNLIFAWVLARKHGLGGEVVTNCLVNNVTNMTLVLGVPAIIWDMNLLGQSGDQTRGNRARQINRLSLLITLIAALFFAGTSWVLGADGVIGLSGGLLLVAIFLLWQCLHLLEVWRNNIREQRSFGWKLLLDLALLAVGAYGVYVSTDWLVNWVSNLHTGFISVRHLGWLSGWLMVLPNAVLAVYYGCTHRPEVVYTSQVGDNHISIPLCLGLFALFQPIHTPAFFQSGMLILIVATVVHFVFVAWLGRLPRLAGCALVVTYAYFVWTGLLRM